MLEWLKIGLKGKWRFIAAYLLIFGVLLYPLLLRTFPPGADVGHMLTLSYTFEGTYIEGSLRHPPIFPFIMFLLYRISFGNIGIIFVLTKILGVALTLPFGVAFFLLSKQLEENQLAAKFGFFLAILSPLFLYEILWSGYPQFLGMTFAVLSIFWLLKSEEGSRFGELACALFASLTVGSHSYTAIFLCMFLFVYSICRVLTTEKKIAVLISVGKIGILTLLFSIPYFFFYRDILYDMKTEPFPTSFSLFLDSIKWEILVSSPVLGLELLVLVIIATTVYVRRHRQMAKSIKVLSALTVSAVLMFFFTPSVSANRVLYFLMIPASVLVAGALSHMSLPQRLFQKRENEERSGKKWAEALALFLVFLMAATSITHYFLSINSFTPLGSASLHAFEAIKRDSSINDKVLVTSYWPEFDSWWLEGITKCEAFERGSVRWFILQSEVERVTIGKTLLFGTHIIDGGSVKLLDSSPYLEDYTHVIMTVSGAGALGILAFTDSSTNVVAQPITDSYKPQKQVYPLSSGEAEIAGNNSLVVTHLEKWGVLEKRLSLNPDQDSALIKYGFSPYSNYSICNVTLGVMSFDEILFEDIKQESNILYVTYRHEWEGTNGSFRMEIKSNATIAFEFEKYVTGNSYLLLKLVPSSHSNATFDVVLEMKMDGIDVDTPTLYSIYAKCREEHIKYVYIRGETWVRKKFERDPNFVVFYKEEDVIVYKYISKP